VAGRHDGCGGKGGQALPVLRTTWQALCPINSAAVCSDDTQPARQQADRRHPCKPRAAGGAEMALPVPQQAGRSHPR
jgi:hypothetical protein